MINKRLLIKNLLAHNDESSFYDKKRQLNLHLKEGKAKFLKHICALSNSNPSNNSYIVVGVEDQENTIVGEDFFDDSRIQNLVNAYLENPPQIQYENIHFPQLEKEKVIGLVTIKPNQKISSFKKSIHTIAKDTKFVRIGSNSTPTDQTFTRNDNNAATVLSIENNSRNSISNTLDGVMDFMNRKNKDVKTKYKVFKELFVICWAGIPKKIRQTTYYSRVDISLINEQVKLFYSSLDEVVISYNEDQFVITEYVKLGLNDLTSYYPLEQITLTFYENGYYKINSKMLFEPPNFSKKLLTHIYQKTLTLLENLSNNPNLGATEHKAIEQIPSNLMICYLNGFEDAKEILINAKLLLKKQQNSNVYLSFKESLRILRKMQYAI